jgi:serine/threonine protein kinase
MRRIAMTCPRCGSQLSATANCCANCGAGPSGRNSTTAAPPVPAENLAPTVTTESSELHTLHFPERHPSGQTSGDGHRGPLAVGQPFGTRYHIIKVLGVGGMGAVYQGWDTELNESVAIKVIRPEALEDQAAALELERRFKRELLLARQVTHPNVVRIHDLGDVDGIKYITMTYVDGTDLATWLSGGPLDVPRTLKIARSIVDGLQAAHAAGIVHRDLKPANIMIRSDGDALIMDFGIARSMNAPADRGATPVVDLPGGLRYAATGSSEVTMPGAIVGTVRYMAPEQARGDAVDERTDIYAFGLIIYDCLAGQHRASKGGSAVEELERRIKRVPDAIKSVVPTVPDPLNELISRCVEPDPAKRFPAERLSGELFVEPRAYAKQLQGLAAFRAGDVRQALTTIREANDMFSTWIGEFDIGRASLRVGAFAQADSAFDNCLNGRRGESLAIFVDEEPTVAYLPQVYYYQGLVREGLKNAGAADSFREYLAIRGASMDDALVVDARSHLSGR